MKLTPLTQTLLLCSLILLQFLLSGCEKNSDTAIKKSAATIQIAFMPDIHFHDIYGSFNDNAFSGLETQTAQGVQQASIRSMRAQLQSTRLFNENYFALIAALDDIAKRGIKLVALPGDFSDDGQPLHLRGLKKILERYRRDYGMEFFLAPGNHDPNRPFSRPAGKMDYLGKNGKEQAIFSHLHPLCHATASHNNIICSDEVMEWGYEPIMNLFSQYGFFPKKEYLYYETPFSTYGVNHYSFAQALDNAGFPQRHYEICQEGSGGSYKQKDYANCHKIPDSSYLVEPIAGLWLLAIDANVYLPIAHTDTVTQMADAFSGSGDAGYNKVLTHKAHLIPWIKHVVARAQQLDKTLIAFSHFPMQEFYNGNSDTLADVFGSHAFQLVRTPTHHTSELLAETGLKIHIGGHMHLNDTGVIQTKSGKRLINIQAPSLAAYIPAYKLLSITDAHIEVETIQLDEVPRFHELFPHYQAEWQYLQTTQPEQNWNKAILESKNYREFSEWHLRELVRLRFLPKEWPAQLLQSLPQLTGMDLLTLSQIADTGTIDASLTSGSNLEKLMGTKIWQKASYNTTRWLEQQNTDTTIFSSWKGADLILDLYKLSNAGHLARADISISRMNAYSLLLQELDKEPSGKIQQTASLAYYRETLKKIMQILIQLNQGFSDQHFRINLDSGKLEELD